MGVSGAQHVLDLELHDRKVAVSMIGSIPGEHGGARSITDGRAPHWFGDHRALSQHPLATRWNAARFGTSWYMEPSPEPPNDEAQVGRGA